MSARRESGKWRLAQWAGAIGAVLLIRPGVVQAGSEQRLQRKLAEEARGAERFEAELARRVGDQGALNDRAGRFEQLSQDQLGGAALAPTQRRRVQLELASLSLDMGREEEAKLLAEAVLREAPDNAGAQHLLSDLHHRRANALARNSQAQAAAAEYQEVLKADTDPAMQCFTKLALGRLDVSAQRFDQAMRRFREVRDADGQLEGCAAAAQLLLSTTYSAQGDRAKAREALEELLRRYPFSPFAGTARRMLEQWGRKLVEIRR